MPKSIAKAPLMSARLTKTLMTILSCWLIGGTAHTEELTIYGLDILGLHQTDQKGDYDRIIDRLKPKIATPFKIEVIPAARAFSQFEKCQSCCISPANKNPEFYNYGDDFIDTTPMNRADIYIWTKPGTAPIGDVNSLIGKRVGARIGFPYGKTIESKLDLQRVSTIEANIRLLEAGRLDAFVDYVPDSYSVFEKEGKEPFPHNKDKPVLYHNDSILCHRNAQSSAFINEFNQAIAGSP
jgi:hypothetical protein